MHDECPCKIPGWCEEYQMHLTGRLLHICRGHNDAGEEVLTFEKRETYRHLWASKRVGDNSLKEPESEVGKPESQTVRSSGPGTELKRLLKYFGLKSIGGCKCNTRANKMDALGCHWCANHINQIIGWLEEEAKKRGLPFSRIAAKMLVRRAITTARKKGAKE